MGLPINMLAVIRALDENVGRSVSYTELRYLFLFHGGQKGKLPEVLERAVRRWPECLEYDMRIGDGRRLEVWVFVKKQVGPV